MTWAEFNTAVRVFLPSHNRRQGIQTMIDALIKAAVWDLEATVPYYESRTTRTIAPGDFTADGSAAVAELPSGARIIHVHRQDPDDAETFAHFDVVTEREEFEAMLAGTIDGRRHFCYYDTHTGEFFVTPSPIDDNASVIVEFEAKKTDYLNADVVVLDDRAAEMVSYYVLARLALQVDKDPGSAQSYESHFVKTKRKLYSERNPALLTPVDNR